MAQELPSALALQKDEVVKSPRLVVEIDGYDSLISSDIVGKYWRIGDPEVTPPLGGIGLNGLTIGGLVEISNQMQAISLDGTSTRISQQLDIQAGTVSVPNFQLNLVDLEQEVSRIVSPSILLDDILGRKTRVYFGLASTGFPEEYAVIHRGVIDEVESNAGSIKMNIAHPEQLKRQTLFVKATTKLNGAINGTQTTITVDDTSSFLMAVNGPDGSPDNSFSTYIRIDDEIMKVTAKTPTQFTVVRSQLNTVFTAHDDDVEVVSIYVLEGNPIDLALKILCSSRQGNFVDNYTISSFNYISPSLSVSDAIFFSDANEFYKLGVAKGDYFTVTGATNGGNNVTDTVQDIVYDSDSGGIYVRASSTTFISEPTTSAVVDFRSQFDSLPDGCRIDQELIDIDRQTYLRDTYLSSAQFRIYLKEEINAKEFLEKELYLPSGLYSVPKSGRSSCNYVTPPIPGLGIETLDDTNVKHASKIGIKRSTTKNFYNSVLIKFDEDSLEDKFLGGVISVNASSKTQIPVGAKVFTMQSKGLRSDLQAVSIANIIANRNLTRYAFAAQYLQGVRTFFSKFNVEIGDVVVFDSRNLSMTNFETGTRDGFLRLMEVTNKTTDIKTGEISFDLVDTAFSTTDRFAIIAPASHVNIGIDSSSFYIEESYNSRFVEDEYKKWEKFIGCGLIVRSPDYSTRLAYTVLSGVSGNKLTVTPPLGFTPLAGDIIELDLYSNQTDEVKLLFAFMNDGTNDYGDGGHPYLIG